MPEDPRILELLEKLIDSDATPEQVCSEFPELLGQVREQWEQCGQIDAHIDALFGSSEGVSGSLAQDLEDASARFPHIPGYKILGVRGRGGIGIVYQALHLELNRFVALKMLLSGACATRVERHRFFREARAVAALRHPNIVQVHDVGESEGRAYFTMELLEGENLAESLNGVPQTSAEAAAMVATLATAVQCAHQNGIIHRDLKPANVLLTTDGTPKVTDFGLARRLEGKDALTLSGIRLGTPSYMAPEQAIGKETVGPEADVYSLGAILYEMLTGRPPFRGESPAETERQLLTKDPVQPSKLNARVPRDLETICLKCLQKDRRRRYATASALADDLRRFQRNEPITARQTGRWERSVKWVGRHPSASTALLSSAVIAAAIVAATTWWFSQRAATTNATEDALRDAIRYQQQSQWVEADAALNRASDRLGKSGNPPLRVRLEVARHDSQLAARLDWIRLDRAGTTGEMNNTIKADKEYTDAFQDSAIGSTNNAAEIVATRITNSHIRAALVAALYDWMLCADPHVRPWLWDVARLADSDATGWHVSIHDAAVWDHGDALAKSLEDAPLTDQRAPFLLAVADHLKSLNVNPIPFLTRVQAACPQDYWVNLTLADQLRENQQSTESIRFYQAALAIHPGEAIVHNDLGRALNGDKRFYDAIAEFRRALQTDPTGIPAEYNLAMTLSTVHRFSEALPLLEECVRSNPREPALRWELGNSLQGTGRSDEAIAEYRKATALAPGLLGVRHALTLALQSHGHDADAVESQWIEINIDPTQYDAWDGFLEFSLFAGRDAEYRTAREAMLTRFAKSRDPHVCECVGRACLLLPASADDTRRATDLIDRAIAIDRVKPTQLANYYQVAKALAEYRAGHFDSAATILRGKCRTVLGPAPKIILSMSLSRLGQSDEARAQLSKAVSTFDWNTKEDEAKDVQMYQVLRREAEAMIQRNLPATQPAN